MGFEVGVGNVSAIILPIPFNDLHNKSSIVSSVFPCKAGGARSKRSDTGANVVSLFTALFTSSPGNKALYRDPTL